MGEVTAAGAAHGTGAAIGAGRVHCGGGVQGVGGLHCAEAGMPRAAAATAIPAKRADFGDDLKRNGISVPGDLLVTKVGRSQLSLR